MPPNAQPQPADKPAKPQAKRRWYQFSLWAMFVFVTLLCVWLGSFANQAERRRQAVLAIETAGGSVEYDDPSFYPTIGERLFGSWLPRDYFGEVLVVHLENSQVTDPCLAHMESLTAARKLRLDGTQVTDTGLAHLKSMNGLHDLLLSNTQITDTGLGELQDLLLANLWLDGTRVTDAGLVHLKGRTFLLTLKLDDTQVTDAGLIHLTDLTSLTILSLKNTKVTDAGLESLHGLTELKQLWLNGTGVTEAGETRLKNAIPGCRVFR